MKNSRIKKQWARAVKKRRRQQNRKVREIARRLLGDESITEQWNRMLGEQAHATIQSQ